MWITYQQWAVNEYGNIIVLYTSWCLRSSDENIEIIQDRAPIEQEVLRVELDYYLIATHDYTVHAPTRTYRDRQLADAGLDLKTFLTLSMIGICRKHNSRRLRGHYHDPDYILELCAKWVLVATQALH